MFDLKATIGRLAQGQTLGRQDAWMLFEQMAFGHASHAQLGALLMALRVRGETVEEIVGAALAMRARMVPVKAPADAVDIVGTGGDNAGTYNISTCAAFIVAGAGVPVAKHGNRALSSKSGAADVLSALGVNLDQTPADIERCIAEAGIGFMFAPTHHPALKQLMPVRVDLATRTIFNLLGPLLNPAGVRHHLIGVYSRAWVEPLAHALGDLGSERAFVVHGSDGLDEITTVGPTFVSMLARGRVRSFEITPEMVGLVRANPAELKGADGKWNAVALRRVLEGQPSAYRDIALFNAAGGLIAAGVVEDWPDAMALARASVDGGAALATLNRLVEASQPEGHVQPY
ncbi:anthranilate phosphoribosyltransferase [Ralstonia pseudosolanacearum]|uniref:anthranilate phosphoribosyltransferase n=1 Tax=Ralstonia pseudosolanacearum TaxID=1310165 RepID=UPI0007D77F8F|nr:anthranilate phosphoribosyltransferase [Ralstonia pseudosolanacearum]MDC6294667.1 anthranilate phosphoribosyltransferase [Ralstonia pseudosolanacearum]MDD7789916.1 anthranilate phosphoribosyltransferase [Ralstonia pseudosolanacearum]MDN3367664.1 anthranilate phosphoribosyltransferase [Ralstonia pseudosolanacearum]OAK89342.1 anthranilate phosphoribosyltransferase [Ralstonia pseudosolanacearum]QOK89020.1 anthranilate phosphoribosyltransferase [Ralstonia pseudosolanacearum]